MQQAKYAELANWIANKINSGELRAGDRLWSENELSAMFQVSRQTVREAIRLLVHKGMLESHQGSGTYVKSGKETERESNKVVGVVTTYSSNYIFPQIISGVESVLAENGYSMQLAFTRNKTENERRILADMLRKGVDGLIIEPAKSGMPNVNASLYRSIIKRHIPAVFINGYFPDMPIPHIAMDDRVAGFLATDCLIRAGHRKIFGIFKFDDYQGRLRYEGYLDALDKAKISYQDEDVLWYSTETRDSLFRDDGNIAHLKHYTGGVCYNDELAWACIKQCKRTGIEVPERLSIVGIDNSELAKSGVIPITSVAHPKEALGMAAASRLLNLLSGSDISSVQENFTPFLVERSSVRQLNQTESPKE